MSESAHLLLIRQQVIDNAELDLLPGGDDLGHVVELHPGGLRQAGLRPLVVGVGVAGLQELGLWEERESERGGERWVGWVCVHSLLGLWGCRAAGAWAVFV